MFTVDIVTAVFIVVLVALVCATYVIKYYIKVNNETTVRLQEIDNGIEKSESTHRTVEDVFLPYRPSYYYSRKPYYKDDEDLNTIYHPKESHGELITSNGVNGSKLQTWEPEDPTTVFPKVEKGKEYKAEES